MPELKDVHETLEEIPEGYRDLYTEKSGKFECTGIVGMKTTADVARVQVSLDKERTDHKETKATLQIWNGMEHEDVVKKLDRIEELEAASGGKLDDAKIDEIANKRSEGIIKTRIAPRDRKIQTQEATIVDLTKENTLLRASADTRKREDVLRPIMANAKILPEYHEDVLLYAERHLELSDDGKFFAKEGLNGELTAGATPKDWLDEMVVKRPGWLPGSHGGGSRGSGPLGSLTGGEANPWLHASWNMTKQGAYLRLHGEEKALALAKAAGTTVGGLKPAAKK